MSFAYECRSRTTSSLPTSNIAQTATRIKTNTKSSKLERILQHERSFKVRTFIFIDFFFEANSEKSSKIWEKSLKYSTTVHQTEGCLRNSSFPKLPKAQNPPFDELSELLRGPDSFSGRGFWAAGNFGKDEFLKHPPV